jgi:hypothetical protein
MKELSDVWSCTSTPYAFMTYTGTALELIPVITERKKKIKK